MQTVACLGSSEFSAGRERLWDENLSVVMYSCDATIFLLTEKIIDRQLGYYIVGYFRRRLFVRASGVDSERMQPASLG